MKVTIYSARFENNVVLDRPNIMSDDLDTSDPEFRDICKCLFDSTYDQRVIEGWILELDTVKAYVKWADLQLTTDVLDNIVCEGEWPTWKRFCDQRAEARRYIRRMRQA